MYIKKRRRYGIIEYVIQRGDDLIRLSVRFGVPVCMLIYANGLREKRDFGVGKRLQIPNADFCAHCTRGYLVREGDTVYGIAEKNGMAMHELLALNGLAQPNELHAGMRLTVEPTPGDFIYTVKPAETLFDIAQRFGISEEEIMQKNGIGEEIYPGMQLRLQKREYEV